MISGSLIGSIFNAFALVNNPTRPSPAGNRSSEYSWSGPPANTTYAAGTDVKA